MLLYFLRHESAGVAQLAEQLICNQQVAGSSPITSSKYSEGFPSGQRGQTVNLLSVTSVVRIHPPPPEKTTCFDKSFFQLYLPTASYIASQLYSAYAERYRASHRLMANIISLKITASILFSFAK